MSRWRLNTWNLIGSAVWVMACVHPLAAQVIPDNTLPAGERSQVTGHLKFQIDGGARQGSNLFHSFQSFSIPTGGSAYFNNTTNVQNIFSRVTGGSISNIDGVIRANGTANLFLINPNGIVFGQNAQLNIGGSFVATTASAIGFGNQGFFSATNPNTPPLLTINPTALLFNQIHAASIQNNSVAPSGANSSTRFKIARGLRVPNGKSLLLVGGDIKMDGGGLYAFGGRVELGGLSGTGIVGLNTDGNNLSLSFPASLERSDIFLRNGTEVNVYGANGSIAVNTRNLEMTRDSSLGAGISRDRVSDSSKAGNVSVKATGTITLNNRSAIANQVLANAKGEGGDVSVSASKLQIMGGAGVYATTYGAGSAGSLRVEAQDVQLIGRSADNQFPSTLDASTQPSSTKDAGDLMIKTNTLLVRDGAVVSVSTRGAGNGGSLRVEAQDVQLIGRSTNNQNPSGLFASTQSRGNGGDLIIKTNTLLVRDGAVVSVSTRGAGHGGSLRVEAQDVQLIGRSINNQNPSGLFASTQSTGDARDLTIQTNTLLVRDGAAVNVQSLGKGSAGNLILNAHSIILNNNALLSATTSSAKVDPNREQATIDINTKHLIIARNSNIITNATGKNVIGGNININTDILAGVENSDITANSTNFRGGNVSINALSIFGIQPRLSLTPFSDITATGATDALSGTIDVNTAEIDPSSSFVVLPINVVDSSRLIARGCPANEGNSFVVTGRGGLPPNPEQQLDDDADWQDHRKLVVAQQRNNRISRNQTPHPTTYTPIIEATGWQMTPTGEIMLVAATPDQNAHNGWQQSSTCNSR